jgi:hypothetical protein
MVRPMPTIRPSQLSTLKALDPLHQQPQRGEDDDRQADVQQVGHGPSSDCLGPGTSPGIQMTMQSYLGKCRFRWVHAASIRGGREP